MTILAFITDLFLQADIGNCVVGAGGRLKAVTSLYKFLPELEQKPDLVLLDLGAEGISAVSLISQLTSRGARPPVVLCADEGQLEEAHHSGADYVINKAKVQDELRTLLDRLTDPESES